MSRKNFTIFDNVKEFPAVKRKAPHTPSLRISIPTATKRWHKLVQEVIHAARTTGPPPPSIRRPLEGGSVTVGRSGTSGSQGHPLPRAAAQPPPLTYKTAPGGNLRKSRRSLEPSGGERGARYHPCNARHGAVVLPAGRVSSIRPMPPSTVIFLVLVYLRGPASGHTQSPKVA